MPRTVESRLRRLLWNFHGCPQHALNANNKALVCLDCGIDFWNMPIQDIELRLLDYKIREAVQATPTLCYDNR